MSKDILTLYPLISTLTSPISIYIIPFPYIIRSLEIVTNRYRFSLSLYSNPILLTAVSDSVNRGTSTARRMQASLYDWIVYQRRYKAKEGKGEEGQRRSKFYAVLESRELT